MSEPGHPRPTATRVRAVAGPSMAGLAFLGFVLPSAGWAAEALTRVNPDWIVSESEAVAWHREKDRYGPAITGSPSWLQFMASVEDRLRHAGVVDIQRNEWTFPRWHTTDWPDDSGWSLEIDGRPIRVASFGANSGDTGPDGMTAPLLLYDPRSPAADMAGRIVVLPVRVDESNIEQLAGYDFEFRSAPASYPQPGGLVPNGQGTQGFRIFAQLLQARKLIDRAVEARAAGALVVFDSGRELAAGLYTFPTPALYDMPTLLLDRSAGAQVIELARGGHPATLRLEASVTESTAYQLIGYLPGRAYGTPDDEVIQLTTHTDGPSISQDNGALGILGIVGHMSRVPQQQRPRTLMVFLDCRHFMPGQESAFAAQDWFARRPEARARVVAMIGVEHLGQIEYREDGDRLVPSGRVDPSMLWVTDNDELVRLAIQAVDDQDVPSVHVRNVDRPGVNGREQGTWYGMAKSARQLGLPAFATMGSMGAYWSMSSGIERFDPALFRRQVAMMTQLTGHLMVAEMSRLRPKAAP